MNLWIKASAFIFSILMASMCRLYAGFPNNNLFNPYDILLFKPMPQDSFFDLDVAYEGAFRVRAYQADPDDRLEDDEIQEERNLFRRRADPLQLWQNYQEFFSALEGTQNKTKQDTDARAFNIRQERLSGRLLPHADLHVPVNLMFAARFALPFDLTLGFYLPFFMSELKNVRWEHAPTPRSLRKKATFTGLLDHELERLEKAGNIDLRNGWKRHGIGDLTALLWWWHDYPQAKQWLKNVRVGARGGLTFPTGDRGDIHKLFQLPFGHDGGVGVLFGGTLELGFGRYVKLGVDGEFLQLFGSVKERRFMTDQRQTDLIFLNKRFLHVDPGFMQHYTLYVKTPFFADGLSSTVAYQHTRQHEDSIVLDKPIFDARTINEAESFQDWTTHSIVWKMDYDFCAMDDHAVVPGVSLFAKYGFNGKRALLFDTLGIQLNLSF